MLINNKINFLIIGLGLMGGSYARALKKFGFSVNAIDTRKAAIEYAIENNIIDNGADWADPEIVGKADYVIFAVYPKAFKEWILENQHMFKPGITISDVTGVKSCIVYDIQEVLRDDLEFIAAHPMAGREVYGVENSDERIFQNANFIIVPTEKNTKAAIDFCRELGTLLGFRRISELSPEEHDEMIGFVSQLTHCIAVSLMTCEDSEHLVDYTGDSFRDLTRIAKINEDMWTELFMLNREKLLAEMEKFQSEFANFHDLLKNGDVEGMKDKMRLSTRRRALFDVGPKTYNDK